MATAAKKTPAKKASAKKATAGTASKKAAPTRTSADTTAATKAPAKKSPAKKAPAKKAAAESAAATTPPAKAADRKSAAGKTGAARRPAAKHASPEKDPKGGLTAAGRAAFAARDGSHLKPGVTKSDAEMSLEDMLRKGSWAVRFYGRKSLPPLVDAKGEPTRFALSAHAWGEPVPTTEAEARRIADRGRQLLERHAAAAKKTPPAKRAPARKAPETPA